MGARVVVNCTYKINADPKETGMQLRERFISKWHMDQSVKERLDQGVTKEV
jgi:hypothetical protein